MNGGSMKQGAAPILLVENSRRRVADFNQWLPTDFRFNHVRSANIAVETIRRDPPRAYAGIMLDFDLDPVRGVEVLLSGQQVCERILERVDRSVPILVHSMNPGGAEHMRRRLDEAGFSVTKTPYDKLNEALFLEWLEECREMLEDWRA